MSVTVKRINAALNEARIPLEIARGKGYQYFIYDTRYDFETVTIPVCWLNTYTIAEWVTIARLTYADIQKRLL